MTSVLPLSLVRNGDVSRSAPTRRELEAHLRSACQRLLDFVANAGGALFKDFEVALRDVLNGVGRSACELFLGISEERSPTKGRVELDGRRFRPAPKQARNLTTMFGVVRYWRGYLREIASADRRGFYPVDVELGLTSDRLTMNVLGTCARLATKMSFAEAKATASLFIPQAPSTEVIERTVLGLGHHTEEWFADRPAPEGDGDVLVVMIDSKGAPTATDEELARRRGPRPPVSRAPSPRHRGRQLRHRYPPRPRLNKGDKSKNARLATMIVMYTLRRRGRLLLGPINRRFYASFAPKEHAFRIARREADKRGFKEGSGKLIQFVSDGDTVLNLYAKQYFPTAKLTIDVMHVVEKIWDAGAGIYTEGTIEHRGWVQKQRRLLFDGKARRVLAEVKSRFASTPKTGPGNKGRRRALALAIKYIEKRIDMLDYDVVAAADLEIATGQIEGAIKNVIGKRCDHGGMRWIRERVEAVVQLRCIELNGEWDAFISRVHDVTQQQGRTHGMRCRLQTDTPRAVEEHPQTSLWKKKRQERVLSTRRDRSAA